MDVEILKNHLEYYIQGTNLIKKDNQILKYKKIRNGNFPSHISENITRLILQKI